MIRTRTCFVAPALALLVVTGCGDDDAGGDTAATTSTSTVDDDAVVVAAEDYRYDDLPSVLAAGSTVTLHNASTAEVHELVLLRLADDDPRSIEELLALPQDELEAVFAAPPSLVLVAPPGQDGFVALGDGTVGAAGRYVAMCFIPTGADPQAFLDALEATPGEPPAIDGGPPHFTAGMSQEVTVR